MERGADLEADSRELAARAASRPGGCWEGTGGGISAKSGKRGGANTAAVVPRPAVEF